VDDQASVLLVSHAVKQRCGIYQFGAQLATALQSSKRYAFSYAECSNEADYWAATARVKPALIIYNHSPTTMPWLRRGIMRRARAAQVGVIHEVTQAVADGADDSLFEFHIAPDPTLELRNPTVFKTGRLVPDFRNDVQAPRVPTIGSFGFGTHGKGFDVLIERVQAEFDEAVIRLHIPFSDFFDAAGSSARAIADRCRGLVTKPGVSIELSHDFLTNEQLLGFLAGNSLNAFLYDDQPGRGISSVIDHALAVRRPIAVSRSSMFRHLHRVEPPVTVEDASLREILARGFAPLAPYAAAWTQAALVADYERIVDSVLATRRAAQPASAVRRIGRDVISEADTLTREAGHRIARSRLAEVSRGWLKRHPRVRQQWHSLRHWIART